MKKTVDEESFAITKNYSPICIYFILKKYSDADHPMTQEAIADKLRELYGISLERQAIGRIIDTFNNEFGIEISSAKRKGSWYSDPDDLESYELQAIIDALFCCRYIPASDTKRLITKLCKQTNMYFDANVKYTYSTDNLAKNYNRALFWNIELVNRAITKKKQIKFDFNRWDVNKKLKKTRSHVVSPYRLVVHSGRYYLKAHCEGAEKPIFNYPLDHITNMEILENSKITDVRTFKGYESGIGNEKMGTNLPYMYTDEHQKIVFLMEENMANDVIEWLGDTVIFSKKKRPDGRIEATIITSPAAMKWWFLQYNELEVIYPKSLVEDVKKEVKRLSDTYNK